MQANTAGLLNQHRASQYIHLHGQLLQIERWPSGAKSPTLTQMLWAIPLAMGAQAAAIFSEGGQNADNEQPHTFIFEGFADLEEDVDRINYRGWLYKITSCVPTGDIAGVVTSWTARAIRDGKAATNGG